MRTVPVMSLALRPTAAAYAGHIKHHLQMFPKISKAAAAATVLLVSVAQTNACLCDGDVTSITTYNYVNELASNNTDVLVVRATALSR